LRRVGFVTIGQSPRVDVVSEMLPILGNIEIVECGALDDLSRDEIELLAPRESGYILVSRLRDGSEVKMDREKILPLVQRCIDRVEREADVVGLLCTGEFPELKSSKLLIEPSEILLKVVEALKVRRLGVVVPNPGQIELTKIKWSKVTEAVTVVSASPYTEGIEEIRRVSTHLRNCDLIVLDCIGYTTDARRAAVEATGKPVLLPRTLMAHIIRDLIEG